MNKLPYTIGLILFLAVSGCDNEVNNFDLDEEPLAGKIEGTDWHYTVGRLEYSSVSNQAAGNIYNETLSDPCLRLHTIEAHLQVAFPTADGYYNLPFINNTGYIKFVPPNGGTSYTASGGFIQIVEVNSYEIIGYISADFDDNTFVKGSFLARICD